MHKNGITRRAIARAFTALPIAAATVAQASAVAGAVKNEQTAQPAPVQPAAAGEANPLQKAHDQVRQTSEKLRAIDVAMTVEPAFTFRA